MGGLKCSACMWLEPLLIFCLQEVSVSGGLTVLNLTSHCALVPENIHTSGPPHDHIFFYKPLTPSALCRDPYLKHHTFL